MRIVVALGGNALLKRGEKPDSELQLRHIRRAAKALVRLTEHELVICHGNGPQIGLLAMESEADRSLSRPYPLDVLDAQTQGMIGYWLCLELANAGARRPTVALVTRTLVDAADPAFERPTKFIGPIYREPVAQRLAAEHGWQVARDGGQWWRRVVASPEPVRILEAAVAESLVRLGQNVICGGGGGAPVVQDSPGHLSGVEAVVDKDSVAALLALDLSADALLLLTDVSAVMADYGTDHARPLSRLTLAELAGMQFPDGSMAPKVQACARFTGKTGNLSAIGALEDAAALLDGTAGTRIVQR